MLVLPDQWLRINSLPPVKVPLDELMVDGWPVLGCDGVGAELEMDLMQHDEGETVGEGCLLTPPQVVFDLHVQSAVQSPKIQEDCVPSYEVD